MPYLQICNFRGFRCCTEKTQTFSPQCCHTLQSACVYDVIVVRMLLLVFAVSLGIVALAALVQATRCPSPPSSSSVPPSTVVIVQLHVYCTFVASDLPGQGRGDRMRQGQEPDDERDAEQAEEAEHYHVPVQETQQY